MLHPALHGKPAPVDASRHRGWRLRRTPHPLNRAGQTHLVFVTEDEFPLLCKEYPLLFVPTGERLGDQVRVAPVAVFGIVPGGNVFTPEPSKRAPRWQGRQVPRQLGLYPFGFARISQQQWGLCLDEAWQGWSQTRGEALFDASGHPTPYLQTVYDTVAQLERDVETTRRRCDRWMDHGLLTEQAFNTTWPDGSQSSVGGFLALDPKRLQNLSRSAIADLHRDGSLMLLTCHQVSLSNWATLTARHWQRMQRSGTAGESTPSGNQPPR